MTSINWEKVIKIAIAIAIILLIFFSVFAIYKKSQKEIPPLSTKFVSKNIKEIVSKINDVKDIINIMTVELNKKSDTAKPPTCNPLTMPANSPNYNMFKTYRDSLQTVSNKIAELQTSLANYRIENTVLQIKINNEWYSVEKIVTRDLLDTMKKAMEIFSKDLQPFIDNLLNGPDCENYCGSKDKTTIWTPGTNNEYPKCSCNQGYTKPAAIGLNKDRYVRCTLTDNSIKLDTIIKNYNEDINLINKDYELATSDSQGCLDWKTQGLNVEC